MKSRTDAGRVPGAEGYDRSVDRFIEVSLSLDFTTVCKAFIPFLPPPPARILDMGSGVGQNAAALSEAGYTMVAVEPVEPFLAKACAQYAHLPITWLRGSLPGIECLQEETGTFDFVLAEAVWHHLSPSEQTESLDKLASMLAPGGKLALSLRNGPAGLGTCVYSTDTPGTVVQAQRIGLECLFRQENIRSLLPNKDEVRWSRIVLSNMPGHAPVVVHSPK